MCSCRSQVSIHHHSECSVPQSNVWKRHGRAQRIASWSVLVAVCGLRGHGLLINGTVMCLFIVKFRWDSLLYHGHGIQRCFLCVIIMM